MKSHLEFALTGRFLRILFPIMGLAGLIVPLAFGQQNLTILGSYLALPLIVVPLFFKRYSDERSELFLIKYEIFNVSLSLISTLCLASIITLIVFEVRTLIYYSLICFISVLILIQILMTSLDKYRVYIVLLEIISLFLNIIWGVSLKYFYFVGRTDALSHAWYIQNLVVNGHVTSEFGVYSSFPLWHILISDLLILLHLPVSEHMMMFFANGIIYAFLIISIYLIFVKLFDNVNLALLGCLFTVFCPFVMFYGMYSIPRSVVSCLEMLLVVSFLLRKGWAKGIVIVVLTLSIIIYHTASMPFILINFLIIFIIQYLYRVAETSRLISFQFLRFAAISTLFYWFFFAQDLIEMMMSDITSESSPRVISQSALNAPLVELINYLQYVPFLILIIVGSLYAFQTRRMPNINKTLFMAGLLEIPAVFPGPSLLINKLARNFNMERSEEHAFIFLIIASAFGFYILFYKVKNIGKLILIILFILITLLSISNDFVASDNPLVKRPFYTFYLNENETICFGHVAKITMGYLMTDYVASRYLTFSQYNDKSHILEIDTKNMKLLRNSSQDIILIRESELQKRPLSLFNSTAQGFTLDPSWTRSLEYVDKDQLVWNKLVDYNKIHTSGGMYAIN